MASRGTGSGARARSESVMCHIQRLLTARQGCLGHLPDYGLPPLPALYQDVDYVATQLAEAVRRTLLRYEPRLVDVRVTAAPAPPGSGYVVRLGIEARVSPASAVALELGVFGDGSAYTIREV